MTVLQTLRIVLTLYLFFFFNDTATTEIYTLSLHDALPICIGWCGTNQTLVPHFPRSRSEVFPAAREARTARASGAAKKAAVHTGCQVFPSRGRFRPPEFSNSAKPRYPPRKREGVFRWGKSRARETRVQQVGRSARRRER